MFSLKPNRRLRRLSRIENLNLLEAFKEFGLTPFSRRERKLGVADVLPPSRRPAGWQAYPPADQPTSQPATQLTHYGEYRGIPSKDFEETELKCLATRKDIVLSDSSTIGTAVCDDESASGIS